MRSAPWHLKCHAAHPIEKLKVCSFSCCCRFMVNAPYEELAMSSSFLVLTIHHSVWRPWFCEVSSVTNLGTPRVAQKCAPQLAAAENLWRLHKSQARARVCVCELRWVHDTSTHVKECACSRTDGICHVSRILHRSDEFYIGYIG